MLPKHHLLLVYHQGAPSPPAARLPRHTGAESTRGERPRGLGSLAALQAPAKPGLKLPPVLTVRRVRSRTHAHVLRSRMWDRSSLCIPAGDKTQEGFH